MTLSTCR